MRISAPRVGQYVERSTRHVARKVATLRSSTCTAAFDTTQHPIAIIGTGKFGLSMMVPLAQRGFPLVGITRNPEDAEALNRTGIHPRRLQHLQFIYPNRARPSIDGVTRTVACQSPLFFSSDMARGFHEIESLVGARPKTVMIAVPGAFALQPIRALHEVGVDHSTLLTSLIKAFVDEPESGRRIFPTTLLEKFFPGNPVFHVGGPSFADGLVNEEPTHLNVVCSTTRRRRGRDNRHLHRAHVLADILHSPRNRLTVEGCNDAIGLLLIQILKNAIAIGTGACEGVGYSIGNAFEALRYILWKEEMILVKQAGGDIKTFLYPGAMGDQNMTSSSKNSRNYKLGYLFGRTWKEHNRAPTSAEVQELLKGEVAEGARTMEEVIAIADRFSAFFPFTGFRAIHRVLRGENIYEVMANLSQVQYPPRIRFRKELPTLEF